MLQCTQIVFNTGEIDGYSFEEVHRKLFRIIWQITLPNKIKHFLWRCCMDILPNAGNLESQRVDGYLR